MRQLGPTRPEHLTIWPWRATPSARLLTDAGIPGRLTQSVDGAWEVRVGPVPGSDVARVIDEFVW